MGTIFVEEENHFGTELATFKWDMWSFPVCLGVILTTGPSPGMFLQVHVDKTPGSWESHGSQYATRCGAGQTHLSRPPKKTGVPDRIWAPENGWLEYSTIYFPFGDGLFLGAMLVLERVLSLKLVPYVMAYEIIPI